MAPFHLLALIVISVIGAVHGFNLDKSPPDFANIKTSGLQQSRKHEVVDEKPSFGPGGDAPSSGTEFIINGHFTEPGEHPFICFLAITTPEYFSYCGSVIYNRNTILTAAHCVPDDAVQLNVTCGEHNVKVNEGTEQWRVPTEWILHAEYNLTGNIENDIAVLKVDSLKFNKFVAPAETTDKFEGLLEPCFLVGWGMTEEGRGSPVLKDTDTNWIQPKSCIWNMYGMATDNQMCFIDSGYMNTAGGACNGDSGGPAVCGGYLVGLTSFGQNGCHVRYPQVYTRVSRYMDWIKANAYRGPSTETGQTCRDEVVTICE